LVESHLNVELHSETVFGQSLNQGLYIVAITQNGSTKVIKVNKLN
jgi:hypothetical protein